MAKRGRILVIEDRRGEPTIDRIESLYSLLRKNNILNDNDVFLWQESNINRIYWVSDSWLNNLVNSWRLKRLLKHIKKHG